MHKKNFKVGYTFGSFDMFNVAHLNILRQAKEQCEHLIVGVNTDELDQNQNSKSNIIPFEDRIAIVDSCRYVDEVVAQTSMNEKEVWETFHFNALFKSSVSKGCDIPNEIQQLFKTVVIEHTIVDLPIEKNSKNRKNKTVVGYTTGVYDMFHIGHLNIIKKAKELCDYLIVGVSTDELVQHDKNKTPIVSFNERCAIIAGCQYVDMVVPQINKDKFAAWQSFQFDKMFVGSDWQGTDTWKRFEEQFAPLGVDIVYLPHTDGISSTILRKRI